MKYGILGATGPTGLELIKQLPEDQISLYVRNPSKLPNLPKSEIVQGDLSDQENLASWVKKQDTVFITLGHKISLSQIKANLGLSNDYADKNLLRDAVSTVLEAKPRRIVYCSAYGTRETRQDLPGFFKNVFLPLLIAQAFKDHEEAEELLQQYQGEWVVARPGMLTNDLAKEKYRAQIRFRPGENMKIARSDVASFMIKCANEDQWLRKFVGLSY